MNDPTNAAEAVANGAQELDEQVPGWWRMIDLDTLSMKSCSDCIVGQLRFATKWYGALGPRPNVLHRFAYDKGFDSGIATYAELDYEWRLAIEVRLAADQLPTATPERELVPA